MKRRNSTVKPAKNLRFSHRAQFFLKKLGIAFYQIYSSHSYAVISNHPGFKITLREIKGGWSLLSSQLGGVMLTLKFIHNIVRELYFNHILTNSNYAFIVKVMFKDGRERNIGPIQIINIDTPLEAILDIYETLFNKLDSFYVQNEITGLSLIFKPTDSSTIINDSDIPETSKESVSDKVFLEDNPIIPTSLDLKGWGTIIKDNTKDVTNSEGEVLKMGIVEIRSYDGKYHFKLIYTPKGIFFTVHNIIRKSGGKTYLNSEGVIEIIDQVADHFELTIGKYTIEFKGGNLIKGYYPVMTTFMKTVPQLNNIDLNDPLKMITIDLETRFIKDVEGNSSMKPYSVGIYDGLNYYDFYLSDFNGNIDDMMNSALKTLLHRKYNNYTVFAHNLANFDIYFLLKYLVILGKPSNLLDRDGKLLSFNLNYKGVDNTGSYKGSLTFHDSILLLPSSLAKLAKDFKVDTLKGHFPYFFVNQDTDLNYVGTIPAYHYFNPKKVTKAEYEVYCKERLGQLWSLRDETLLYMKDDCLALYQVLFKFLTEIKQQFKVEAISYPTLPSLAFAVFRSNFYNKLDQIPITVGKQYKDISKAFYGGIVDVYHPHGFDLYYYDVNSLYPYAMQKEIPIGPPTYHINSSNLDLNDPSVFGFFFAKVTAPDNLHIPVLPFRSKGTLICPTGTFEGWYFSEELREAQNRYGYHIELVKGYSYKRGIPLTSYVNHFYSIKRDGSESQRAIAKLILNSLFGRFGISPNLSHAEIVKSSTPFRDKVVVKNIIDLGNSYELRVYERLVSEGLATNLNISVPLAAAITGYSRIIINRFKHLPDCICYYSDTDSVVLSREFTLEDTNFLDLGLKELVGTNIGQMKLEYIIKEGIFLGPKMYGLLLDNEKTVVKVKGYKNPITFSDIKSLLTIDSITREHTIWTRDMTNAQIILRDQIYTISVNSNKRIIVRDVNGIFTGTQPIKLNYPLLSSENKA